MVVALVWIAAAVIGLAVFAALGLGLMGHVRRVSRATAVARDDLSPRVRDLLTRASRHPPST